MGWTYSHRYDGESEVAWLRRMSPDTWLRIEEAELVRKTSSNRQPYNAVYALYRIKADDPRIDERYRKMLDERYIAEPDGSILTCLIYLIGYDPRASDGYNTGYKDEDETVGSMGEACPKSILDKLSKLTDHPRNEYARAWRVLCGRDDRQLALTI